MVAAVVIGWRFHNDIHVSRAHVAHGTRGQVIPLIPP